MFTGALETLVNSIVSGVPQKISEITIPAPLPVPTRPERLAGPLNPLTVNPLASFAVTVAEKGTPMICGVEIALHWNPASAPACTAKVLLDADNPPLLSVSATA